LIIETHSENWAIRATALTILSFAHIQGQLLIMHKEASDDDWILPDSASDLLFGGILYQGVTLNPLDIVDIWFDDVGISDDEFFQRIQMFARDSDFHLPEFE